MFNVNDWLVAEREGAKNQAVRQELEQLLSSAGFSRNDRQSQFLRFLVERHLEGRDSELKESVAGDRRDFAWYAVGNSS